MANSDWHNIDQFRAKAQGMGIDLNITVYDSFIHPLSWGRVPSLNKEELEILFHALDRNNVQFALALNGEWNWDVNKNDDILSQYPQVLDLLNQMAEWKSNHASIIANHRLFDEIKIRFWNRLKTIASCIQFAWYFNWEYHFCLSRAISEYDAVVVDNPNVQSWNVLEKYSWDLGKIILFLNSRCSKNMEECRGHYRALNALNISASKWYDIREQATTIYKSFDWKMPNVCENEKAMLLHENNRWFLGQVIKQWIYQFKISRESAWGSGVPLGDRIWTLLDVFSVNA